MTVIWIAWHSSKDCHEQPASLIYKISAIVRSIHEWTRVIMLVFVLTYNVKCVCRAMALKITLLMQQYFRVKMSFLRFFL